MLDIEDYLSVIFEFLCVYIYKHKISAWATKDFFSKITQCSGTTRFQESLGFFNRWLQSSKCSNCSIQWQCRHYRQHGRCNSLGCPYAIHVRKLQSSYKRQLKFQHIILQLTMIIDKISIQESWIWFKILTIVPNTFIWICF